MKKIFAFAMLLAAAAVASVSCTKDVATDTNPAPELSGNTKTITLNQFIAETRTQQNSDSKALEWAEGDTFGIFCVGDDEKVLDYVKSPEYGSDDTAVTVPEETKYFYCVYPYDEKLKEQTNMTHVEVEIPQNPSLSSEFDGSKVIMVAKSEISEENSVNLAFTPIVAVFELNIYNSDKAAADKKLVVSSIDLDVNDSEDAWCAGTTQLDFTSSDDKVSVENISGSYIYASCTDNATVGNTPDTGAKYYLYLAKTDYEKINVEIDVLDTSDEFSTSVAYKLSYSNVSFEGKYGYTLDIDLAKAKTDSDNGDDEEEEVGEKYDFASEEFKETLAEKLGTETTSFDETINDIHLFTTGSTKLVYESTRGCIKLAAGGTNGEQQYISFNAKASGKLKLDVGGTGDQRDAETDGRGMVVRTGTNGTPEKKMCLVDQNTREILEFDITIYQPTDIYIWSSAGHRLYSIEFIETKIEPTTWDFSSEAWKNVYPERTEEDTDANYVERTDFDQTVDGLRLLAGGSSIRFRKDCIQMGGAGSTTTRVFSFTATSSGNLTIYSSNTSDVEDPNKGKTTEEKASDNERQVYVEFGANKGGKFGGYKSSEPGASGFGVNITEPTTVYIYAKNNGLIFYSIEFTGSVDKSQSED